MKRLTLILFLWSFLLSSNHVFAQLYSFQTFNHKDGLNIASIRSVTQSDDGTIWIGTDGAGLVKFDGHEFTQVNVPNYNSSFHINDIIQYGDSIIFSTQYSGFYYYSIRRNQYFKILSKTNTNSEGEKYRILDKNNHVAITSKEIILNCSGKTKLLYKTNFLLVRETIPLENRLILMSNKGNFVVDTSGINNLNTIIESNDSIPLNELNFGSYQNGKLILFDRDYTKAFSFSKSKNGKFKLSKKHDLINNFNKGEHIDHVFFSKKDEAGVLITNKSRIYKWNNLNLKYIVHNYHDQFARSSGILLDYNDDIWISSHYNGLIKVSQEAFTRVELTPLYQSPNINLLYRNQYGDVILSLAGNTTYVRNINNPNKELKLPFGTYAIDSLDGYYYLATNKGLRIYHPKYHPNFDLLLPSTKRITFLRILDRKLYYSQVNSGIITYNLETKSSQKINSKLFNSPSHFYCAEKNGDQVYFGSNGGIFSFNLKSKEFKQVKLEYNRTGTYCGLSTKDKYGNIWMSLSNGLAVIKPNNEIIYHSATDYFQSNLFYTLIADGHGRILVGTNAGLTLFKTDKEAKIKSPKNFNANNGFDGYETIMRAQFKGKNGIYLGTIEGMFVINTSIFDHIPSPIIPSIVETEPMTTQNGDNEYNKQFKLKINNAKFRDVLFTYRLVNYDDNWCKPTSNNEIAYYDLPNGNYTLEVKATFDGIHYSETGTRSITIAKPLWKTNWFIVLIIAFIVILNILLLTYNKVFDTSSLLDTKDTSVHLKMTPSILLFGTAIIGVTHFVGPLFSDQLEFHLGPSIAITFALFSLYLMSLSARYNNKERLFNHYLLIALLLVIGHFFFELYMSNLHPYHTIGIVLTSIIAPYIISKVKPTIIFSIIVFACGIIISLLIENPTYPKLYFIIALFAMCCLLIFASYLRFDSLEKLLFVSGLINKGSILALAYNSKGKLTYVSENIERFIGENSEEVSGKHITYLNKFIPYDYRETDAVKDFQDGDKYLVPMSNNEGDVFWIEWSYKKFSNKVRVLLGQDVTTRMDLENTYELLVQNAQDFIYRVDIDGKFVFLNDAMIDNLGYEKSEILGSNSLDIVHETFRSDIENYYRYHFQKRLNSSYKEFPVRRKDGSVIWLGQYVTTLFAPGSKTFINGFLALARDVTDFKRQQKLILEQKDSITDSINYAKRIQHNLLPHQRKFASLFKDHFIIYNPKDIVSGDFYWLEKIGKQTILVLADCTGHGVPGAFMTLLGINLLNSIISEDRITDPGKILRELDSRLKETLPKGEGDNKLNDAIEVTVCIFNDEDYEMAYSCAGSRFLIYSNNEFTMYKGSNKHIGDRQQSDDEENYQTNYTEFTPEDQLFLLTDGLQDQFGGPNDKKFSFRRVLEVFEETQQKNLSIQREEIMKELDDWIESTEQTDDVSVISITRNLS